MDFFTSTYTQLQRDLNFAKEHAKEEARQKAVYFFSEMFPDFYDRLQSEGYEIEGGDIQDWSDEGFEYPTCAEVLISKDGKKAELSLMKPWQVYRDKRYTRDSYFLFLTDKDHEELDPPRAPLADHVIKGISEEMINFIGRAFCEVPRFEFIFNEAARDRQLKEALMAEETVTRDELAALAMGGIMAGYGYRQLTTQDIHSVSNDAYAIADAMLAARENGHESKLS